MDGFSRLLIVCGLWTGCSVASARTPDFEQMLDMDLAELMQIPVLTASRHSQALWQAPAVINVLDGDTLRRQGYRSIAQALRQVPGFFITHDGVGHYTTVRGISSGQRAYGRVLKVMIDGQPIGLRSTADAFLGSELIPLSVVERIEVVRGPSSALYGADAYLGIINIITVKNADRISTLLAAGREGSGSTSTRADMQAATHHEHWHVLVSGAGAREDRSGRPLPDSSPDASAFTDDESRNDISRPLSVFLRTTYQGEALTHSLMLHGSERDTHGEFLDFGTLSHDNRLVERQQTLWWQSQWQPASDRIYSLRLAHAWGGNTSTERLSIGATSALPHRRYGYEASDLAVEAQHAFTQLHVVAGFDGSWNHEEPYQAFSIDRDTGDRVQLSPQEDERLFRNLGVYLQLQYHLPTRNDWVLSFNVRNDEQNLYGNHTSYRLGITGQLTERLHTKLLHGTAFKAPNAYQLFAHPLFAGDTLGNRALDIETAETSEFQLLWQANDTLSAAVTLYQVEVDDLIELQPFNLNTRWENTGRQSGWGIETELRWRLNQQEVGLISSWHDTQVRQDIPLLPAQALPTASAPRLMLQTDWCTRWQALEVGASLRYVSERRASEHNIDTQLRTPYTLRSYHLWRFHGSYPRDAHRFTVALDNAFDKEYEEPGYGGIDLPGEPRTLWVSWTWSR